MGISWEEMFCQVYYYRGVNHRLSWSFIFILWKLVYWKSVDRMETFFPCPCALDTKLTWNRVFYSTKYQTRYEELFHTQVHWFNKSNHFNCTNLYYVLLFSFLFLFFLKKIIIAFCKGKSYMRIINENPLNCFATSHKDTTFSCCLCAFVFFPKSSSWVGLFSSEVTFSKSVNVWTKHLDFRLRSPV